MWKALSTPTYLSRDAANTSRNTATASRTAYTIFLRTATTTIWTSSASGTSTNTAAA